MDNQHKTVIVAIIVVLIAISTLSMFSLLFNENGTNAQNSTAVWNAPNNNRQNETTYEIVENNTKNNENSNNLYLVVPSGDKNVRIAAAMLSNSKINDQNKVWAHQNLDLIIGHESLVSYLDDKPFHVKLIMYKTSAWNPPPKVVSVDGFEDLAEDNDDWFLHCGSGYCSDPNTDHESYWMNYKNKEWRDHSIDDINSDYEQYENLDGLFYDAIQITKGELGNPKEYATDREIRDALFDLMIQFDRELNPEFWVNAAPYNTGYEDFEGGPLALGKKLIDLSDGFWDESLAVSWSGRWYDDYVLETQLSLMDYAHEKNKEIAFSALFKNLPAEQHKDVLIFYLLGMNKHTYFGFDYQGYGFHSYYSWINNNQGLLDEAEALGKPTSNRVLEGSTYTRNFENGHITFDMNTHVGEIILE